MKVKELIEKLKLEDETIEENSIEEDIKDIEKYISFTSKRENFSHDTDWNWNKDLANKIEHILSDYKRVLKENEELLQEKINNQKIIVLAQNDMLNYQAGFEDGKNGRTSAVQSIIENQQYYIFQKQIEKYEEHIEKLQKENEELKKSKITYEAVRDIQEKNRNIVDNNYISKQIVKDNLIKYQEEYELLLEHQSGKESNRTKYLRGRIHMCQELLEGRK